VQVAQVQQSALCTALVLNPILPTYFIRGTYSDTFPHESHSVWFLCTLREPRGERRSTALSKAILVHDCLLPRVEENFATLTAEVLFLYVHWLSLLQ